MGRMIIDTFVEQHLDMLSGFVAMTANLVDNQPMPRIHYTTLEDTKVTF